MGWSLPYQATYPSCGVQEQNHESRMQRYHPQLSWLQHAADEAGVKLHVVFLQRDIKDCLALTCLQRNYEDCAHQSQTLEQNSLELLAQLDDLNNDAVSCFR